MITKEFVERLSKLEKICDQFHLSLQSGSDTVLKRMNRRYIAGEFAKSVEYIRKYFPNANLTTDIIVGFPGETDKEFFETYEFVKKINFFKLHVFKYSPKKGTKAAIMPNQIAINIKEERSRALIKLSEEMQKDVIKTYIGKSVKVLFEETKAGYTKGHTTNYMLIKVPKDISLENIIKEIVIKNKDMIEIQK